MSYLVLIAILCSNIHAQESSKFYNPKDLKPGMKGYALTVFEGEDPERMDIEVISYMEYGGFRRSVLIKLLGEKATHTQVAAGMSGSPVYIEEKLVGAIAYTYQFSRDAIAGVTLIEDMLNEKSRAENTALLPKGAELIKTSWVMEGLESEDLIAQIQNVPLADRYTKGVEEFVQVPSSCVGGVAPLKPGDSVSVTLVNGDMKLGGIGTVTYVDGEDVYIFGHKMDNFGPVNLPLSKARIYHVLARDNISLKLGTPIGGILGSTLFDGCAAVYGRFDYQAKMIPVQLNIRGKKYNKTYNLQLVRSQYYSPTLISMLISYILKREIGENIDKKTDLSWKIEFSNNRIVDNGITWVKNQNFNGFSMDNFWYDYISLLWRNPLVQLVPEKMILNVDIKDIPGSYYSVIGMKIVGPVKYRPGDNVTVQVKLKKYLDETFYKNISVALPKNIKAGSYSIMAGGSLYIEDELKTLFPEFYINRTEKQLLVELNKPINFHKLVVVIVDTVSGSIVGNTFLGNLPVSRLSLFENQDSHGTSFTKPNFLEVEEIMDQPVLGIKKSVLDVVVSDFISVAME